MAVSDEADVGTVAAHHVGHTLVLATADSAFVPAQLRCDARDCHGLGSQHLLEVPGEGIEADEATLLWWLHMLVAGGVAEWCHSGTRSRLTDVDEDAWRTVVERYLAASGARGFTMSPTSNADERRNRRARERVYTLVVRNVQVLLEVNAERVTALTEELAASGSLTSASIERCTHDLAVPDTFPRPAALASEAN